MKINFNPTIEQLSEIENWLIKEYEETQSGFYCNWNIINKSFNNNEMVVISENNSTIGFVIYEIYELVGQIDILEIKPTQRGKGIGKKLINELSTFLKSKGILVTRLFCKPEKSEVFWKKIGYMNFPKLRHTTNRMYMYKSTINTLNLINEDDSEDDSEIIELWNLEPYQIKEQKPKWLWKIKYKPNSRIFEKPIIFPIDSDWQIQWKKGKRIIEKDKIKYFKNEIYFGGFMIIKELLIK